MVFVGLLKNHDFSAHQFCGRAMSSRPNLAFRFGATVNFTKTVFEKKTLTLETSTSRSIDYVCNWKRRQHLQTVAHFSRSDKRGYEAHPCALAMLFMPTELNMLLRMFPHTGSIVSPKEIYFFTNTNIV